MNNASDRLAPRLRHVDTMRTVYDLRAASQQVRRSAARITHEPTTSIAES
jgi:hypothetical protein